MTRAAASAAVVALAALAAAAPSPGRASCTAGVTSTGGVTYRTFCGPATASVHGPGLLFGFKGGACTISGGYFTVNLGIITLGSDKPKYTYFGITVFGKKAGTYKNAAVSWQTPGKHYSLFKSTVTVKPGLSGGTFSGQLLGAKGNATGSFSCH